MKRKWAFHCGSQYADWENRYCGSCAKDYEICKIAENHAQGYCLGNEIEPHPYLIATGFYLAYHCLDYEPVNESKTPTQEKLLEYLKKKKGEEWFKTTVEPVLESRKEASCDLTSKTANQ